MTNKSELKKSLIPTYLCTLCGYGTHSKQEMKDHFRDTNEHGRSGLFLTDAMDELRNDEHDN